MYIINGDVEGDEQGSYTFKGHGKSVIGYTIVNSQAWHEIEKF